MIDDDLRECGEDLVINYQLQLRTELSTQLQTELSEEQDSLVREALMEWLSPVFTDKAKDIDLHFFNKETDNIRRRIQDVINASQTSYTLNLPKENYTHLALANLADNNELTLGGKEHSETMSLNLSSTSSLRSLNTGVFTARLDMTVSEASQSFEVYLYMINTAVALVIDTTDCDSLVSIEGTLNDVACGFSLRDSSFSYVRPCAFRLVNVPIRRPSGAPAVHGLIREEEPATTACLATVGMPSRDDAPWTMTVRAKLIGNRYATSTVTLEEPLKAGDVRVLRLRMNEDGSLGGGDNQEVGISVTLEWKDGGDHELEL